MDNEGQGYVAIGESNEDEMFDGTLMGWSTGEEYFFRQNAS